MQDSEDEGREEKMKHAFTRMEEEDEVEEDRKERKKKSNAKEEVKKETKQKSKAEKEEETKDMIILLTAAILGIISSGILLVNSGCSIGFHIKAYTAKCSSSGYNLPGTTMSFGIVAGLIGIVSAVACITAFMGQVVIARKFEKYKIWATVVVGIMWMLSMATMIFHVIAIVLLFKVEVDCTGGWTIAAGFTSFVGATGWAVMSAYVLFNAARMNPLCIEAMEMWMER